MSFTLQYIADPTARALLAQLLKRNLLPTVGVDFGINSNQVPRGDLIVDVRAYGAHGNGTSDDTAAFQTALDAVGDAGGGVVTVPRPSSFYRLESGLTFKSYTILRGYGLASILKWDADFAGDPITIKAPGDLGTGTFINGCGMEHLYLKFQNQAQRVFAQRFFGLRVHDVRIDSSIVTGATCALYLDGGSLTLPDPGALVDYATDADVDHLVTFGFLQAIGSSGARVTQTNVTRCFCAGVAVGGVQQGTCFENISGGSQIHSNEIEGFDIGVSCTDGDCAIMGNRFENNKTSDVKLVGSCQGCAVVGNNHSSATTPIDVNRPDANLVLRSTEARLPSGSSLNSLAAIGPRVDWFNRSAALVERFTEALVLSTNTNLFGQTAGEHEMNLASKGVDFKIGVRDNYSLFLMYNGAASLAVEYPTGAVKVPKGVILNTTDSRPTANADSRGRLWVIQGGTGAADVVEICLKGSDDAYHWYPITLGSP